MAPCLTDFPVAPISLSFGSATDYGMSGNYFLALLKNDGFGWRRTQLKEPKPF